MSDLNSDIIDELDPDDILGALELLATYDIDASDVNNVEDAQLKMRQFLQKQQASSSTAGGGGELGEAELDQLEDDDLEGALSLLQRHNISDEGVSSVDDVRQKLRQHIYSLHEDTSPVEGVAAIKKAIENNIDLKKNMKTVFDDLKGFTKKLPEGRYQAVEKVFPNLSRQVWENEGQLAAANAVILVAGETSSGKSSLLNLLLGEVSSGLLPVSHLAATSVITELRYGATKCLIIYPRSDDKHPMKVELGEMNAADTISQYVHQQGDRDDAFDFKRVEVYWPCEWLQGQVTIVDSPGVGEDSELTELVKQYVPKASAFIYVINTPNAGGIQPDRLQDLLFSQFIQQDGEEESENTFNPASAIFVCNKWDQVPKNERDGVKDVVMKKLHEIWPRFNEEQVFFISVKQIMESLKLNQMPSSLQRLLDGINRLIPIGLKANLIPPYKQASRIIQRCNLELKSFVMKHSQTADRMAELKAINSNLTNLDRKPEKIMDWVNSIKDLHIAESITALKEHLSSDATRRRLLDWADAECPPDTTNKGRLNELKSAYATKRIQQEINRWDNESRKFEHIQEILMSCFQEEYTALESQLHREELRLVGHTREDMSPTVHEYEFTSYADGAVPKSNSILSTREKILLGVTSPVWVPLGLVLGVFVGPAFGIKQMLARKKEKKELKEYCENKSVEMAKATEIILMAWLDHSMIKDVVLKKLEPVTGEFDKKLGFIHSWIEADKRIVHEQMKELRNMHLSESEISELELLRMEGVDIEERLAFLYACQLRTYPLEISDFYERYKIGEGTFAEVQIGKWKPDDRERTVALKIGREPLVLGTSNATEFLFEEQNLRTLRAANIVEFYGTTISEDEGKIFPVLVMEYCGKNLYDVVRDRSFVAPGTCDKRQYAEAKARVACYMEQICKGLHAIHKQGFLHRDVKLENILVTENEVLKLADLGLAKSKAQITGTLSGTPYYIAPEVWQHKQYTEMADIFSVGIVWWELWYGSDVSIIYSDPMQANDLPYFKRKMFDAGQTKPPQLWMQNMSQCLETIPDRRPSALEVIRMLEPDILGADRISVRQRTSCIMGMESSV